MGARAKAILPLGVVIGVLSFGWCEVSLNSQFHWITNGDLGVGLALPANFQLIVWIAFVSWGLFFAAGGDTAAFGKIAIASIFGSVAALVTFAVAPKIADLPDFWGISLMVGVMAFILVAILIAGDWYYVAGTFPAFAACFGWVGCDGHRQLGSQRGRRRERARLAGGPGHRRLGSLRGRALDPPSAGCGSALWSP